MKILLVSSFLPYPLHSGGHVRLYNLIKALSGKHEITLICEKRDYQTPEDINEIEKICKKVITIKRKKQWSLQTIAKTGFSFNSFLVSGHALPSMKEAIAKELQKESFDLIHVETFYVYQNLPLVSIPVVLVEHNVEYLVYQRYNNTAPFFLKPLLVLDILKLQQQEQQTWKKATTVVAVSEIEKDIMQKIAKHTAVVPNGVDTKLFTFSAKAKHAKKKILFIGDFRWMQNREAAAWIISYVFPLIKEHLKEVTLWIVGKNIPESIKKGTRDSDIFFDEKNTMPTQEIFQKADVLLAPIRVGGGTSYKILEAMASGTPVVTTKLGSDGIGAKKDVEILLGETAGDLGEQVHNLLTDEKLYTTIAKNGRALIEEKYSWDNIAKKLDAVYHTAKNL